MKDANGKDLCYNYEEISMPDACKSPYKNDAACVLINKHVERLFMRALTAATCMKQTCDRGKDVVREVESSTNACVGIIPCSGGTCETGPKEENNDFGNCGLFKHGSVHEVKRM